MQCALLHNTLGLIVNTIAELTWFIGIRWDLGAFRVELLLNAAAKLLRNAQLSARLGSMIGHINGH